MPFQGFWVRYTVDMGNGPNRYECGPYVSTDLAEDHKRDIAGYEGISNVHIVVSDERATYHIREVKAPRGIP